MRVPLPHVWLLLVGLCAACVAAEDDAPTWPTVPEGFSIELIAAPPLVEHPTLAGFDDRGRLYVCDGPGLNLRAAELLEQLPNMIRRLEDTDGDGRFDKSTVFADRMTFPNGLVWHRGSVYSASPPNIWKLTDRDDDGIADDREIFVSEFGFNGNGCDTHGCVLGPDGRLYWCEGRHGHRFVDEHGKEFSKGLAARVFTCRLDGKDLETFAGGGMDNPVELCFTEEGEPIGTVAIFEMLDGRQDALVHWIYGGVYPRTDAACLTEFRRTGSLMQPMSKFGVVAPSGVVRYRGSQFGSQYQNNLFHAQFNTHQVVRTRIARQGATFRSTDETFLSSENPDFHPTDVLEDADGSLLVVNTGGWFRIGCPTSRIAKPEIVGGIYRIHRTGAAATQDARGLKLPWVTASVTQLIKWLADRRSAVVDRAIDTLALCGTASIEPLAAYLAGPYETSLRLRALWSLSRNDDATARVPLRSALGDRDARVRLAAARALGTFRDAAAYDGLVALLVDDEPPVRREAATALGRVGNKAAVRPLLSAMTNAGGDRFLEHALIYALIELDDAEKTLAGLDDQNPDVRRAALQALDQMPSGKLTRHQVGSLLATNDQALRDTVLDVLERHEGWAGETTELLGAWLDEPQPTEAQLAATQSVLLRFSCDARVQALVTAALAKESTSAAARIMLLEVVGRSDLSELPSEWRRELGRSLDSREPPVVRAALAALNGRDAAELDPAIERVAKWGDMPNEVRVAALVNLGRRAKPLDDAGFTILAEQLRDGATGLDRLAAAEALGGAALSADQRDALLPMLETAGPLELPAVTRAFEKQSNPNIGRRLIAALQKSPGTQNLTPDRFKHLFANYPADVQSEADKLHKRFNVDLTQQREHLAEVAATLDGGSIAAGKKIFFGKKATCSNCHRAGKDGGVIGPELTKVGQIRSRMDLLEAIVYPSASFVRGYESYLIVTTAGQMITGIVARETPEAVYLRTGQREEVRVARSDIEDLVPGKLSVMPQGFDRLLSQEELRDVIAFLQSLKQ
jgi:putative membrane-bound dehydrogenase-like protein